jgi:hypothetical protein
MVVLKWLCALCANPCARQVDVKLSKRGYKCRPTKRKVRKWCSTMRQALADDRLAPGGASKLAGRLSWGASNLFRCVGVYVVLHVAFRSSFLA